MGGRCDAILRADIILMLVNVCGRLDDGDRGWATYMNCKEMCAITITNRLCTKLMMGDVIIHCLTQIEYYKMHRKTYAFGVFEYIYTFFSRVPDGLLLLLVASHYYGLSFKCQGESKVVFA